MATIKKAPMFLAVRGAIGKCRFYKTSVEVEKDVIFFKKSGRLGGPKLINRERAKKESVLRAHTFIIPLGAEHHKNDRNGIMGMCNLRPICQRDMVFHVVVPLKIERDTAMVKIARKDRRIAEKDAEILVLKADKERLLSRIENMAKKG